MNEQKQEQSGPITDEQDLLSFDERVELAVLYYGLDSMRVSLVWDPDSGISRQQAEREWRLDREVTMNFIQVPTHRSQLTEEQKFDVAYMMQKRDRRQVREFAPRAIDLAATRLPTTREVNGIKLVKPDTSRDLVHLLKATRVPKQVRRKAKK